MWNVGDLVYYSHRKDFANCKCAFCKDSGGTYGIITEAWSDEDDTVALLVDFHSGVSVCREPEQKYLSVIYEV